MQTIRAGLFTATLLTCFAAIGLAQPVVTGALNTASYAPAGSPSGKLARGSFVAVFGRNLGPAAIAQASSFPLPKSAGLGGTSARLQIGGQAIDLIMVYSLATQLGVIIPSNTPTGTGQLTITYNGQTSASFAVEVVNSAPGLFAVNQQGSGPGIFQNFNSATDQPINTILNSARPGQTITLWGTGLGPISGDDAAGPAPGDLPTTVQVFVGGRPATVRYKGRSGCCAAIDQIVFDVPAGVTGCYVPVQVVSGGVSSNAVSMAISQNGGTCNDPRSFTSEDLSKAASGNLRVGAITLLRLGLKIALGPLGNADVKVDTADASFTGFNQNELIASQSAALTSAPFGSCFVQISSTQSTSLPEDPIRATVLDAGPRINLVTPTGTRQLEKQQDGGYYLNVFGLGGLPIPIPGAGNPFLEAGNYTADNGSGGTGANAVGGFRVSHTVPGNFVWANEAAVNTIVRSQGQEFTWSGGNANSTVVIFGTSYNDTQKASGVFYCYERGSAGRFTVPSYILNSLPPAVAPTLSITDVSVPSSLVGVGLATDPSRFTASGLDVGIMTYVNMNAKTVSFQ